MPGNELPEGVYSHSPSRGVACASSYDPILPVPRGGWFRLFCSSQHIVEVQLKVAYHDYLEVGYAGHVSSPAKFK